jgi:hypothetical protein
MTNETTPTEIHAEHTPNSGDSERRAMDNPTTRAPGGRPGRKLVVTAVGVVAMALLASAAAWACTLRDGITMEVFRNTYASCTAAGTACSKVVGNGAQTGQATVDTEGNKVMRITGTGFITTADYSVTWRHPGAPGNCHRTNIDGSIVLMGDPATVTSGGTLDVTRTAEPTFNRDVQTGMVRICVQDYEFGDTSSVTPTPVVITGNIADISVV